MILKRYYYIISTVFTAILIIITISLSIKSLQQNSNNIRKKLIILENVSPKNINNYIPENNSILVNQIVAEIKTIDQDSAVYKLYFADKINPQEGISRFLFLVIRSLARCDLTINYIRTEKEFIFASFYITDFSNFEIVFKFYVNNYNFQIYEIKNIGKFVEFLKPIFTNENILNEI